MKLASWKALVPVLMCVSNPSSALTLEITIAGPGRVAYALNVGGVSKNGRLADKAGRVVSREAIEVTPSADYLPATLTFFGEKGPVAVCPAVKVAIEERGAACAPSFTMVPEQPGQAAACRASCERPRRHEAESDETFVAMEKN